MNEWRGSPFGHCKHRVLAFYDYYQSLRVPRGLFSAISLSTCFANLVYLLRVLSSETSDFGGTIMVIVDLLKCALATSTSRRVWSPSISNNTCWKNRIFPMIKQNTHYRLLEKGQMWKATHTLPEQVIFGSYRVD